MSGSTREHILLESHGVRLELEVRALELMPEISRILPPGHELIREFPEDGHLIIGGAEGQYWVEIDGQQVVTGAPAEVAIPALANELRGRVAHVAPDAIFVNAGVVAVDGQALVLPGRSFSGKTTIVTALVAAGATYYSDEFAVITFDGDVLPYPTPLGDGLGAAPGTAPIRLALVADLTYRAGAEWAPTTLSPGAGALALLSNTVPARTRPAQVLEATTRAVGTAKVIAGDRPEADVTARLLLDELHRATTPHP